MAVRAKFKIVTVRPNMYIQEGKGPTGAVELQPVMPKWNEETRSYDKTDENSKFWDATPSGKIELQITNEEAFRFFAERMTKTFYVDFSEAD